MKFTVKYKISKKASVQLNSYLKSKYDLIIALCQSASYFAHARNGFKVLFESPLINREHLLPLKGNTGML